jgi:hypothetical protein
MSYTTLIQAIVFSLILNWVIYLNILGQISEEKKIKNISYSLSVLLAFALGVVILL